MKNISRNAKIHFEFILFALNKHPYDSQEFYDCLIHLTRIANLKLSHKLEFSFVSYNTSISSSEIVRISKTMILLDLLTVDFKIHPSQHNFMDTLDFVSKQTFDIYHHNFNELIGTEKTCLSLNHPSFMDCSNCSNRVCENTTPSLLRAIYTSLPSLNFKSHSKRS